MKNFIIVSTLALLSSVMGDYSSSGPVVQLNAANFRKKVLKNKGITLVKFYAPWCGHCKQLEPTYKKVAEDLQGIATIAAVNCDDEINKPLCSQYEVPGFPTLKLFPSSLTGSPSGKPEDYNGARTKKAIKSFVTEKIPNKVLKITEKAKKSSAISSKLDDFIKNSQSSGQHRSILFTKKDTTSPIYKSLALTLLNRIQFGEIRPDQSAYIEKYNIENFPTLIVEIDNGDDEEVTVKTFDGEINPQSLRDFYKTILTDYPVNSTKSEDEKPKKDTKKSKSKDNEEDEL